MFVDRDGASLDVGDKVEVWSSNAQGEKDWIPGFVVALKYSKTLYRERTAINVQKTPVGGYHHSDSSSFTNSKNIVKVV